MKRIVTAVTAALLISTVRGSFADAGTPDIVIDSPMAPPAWALLQRAVLKAHGDAIEEFYERYFDSRGFLKCVERWGGDDGPDDAIECCADWTLLYALGADERILQRYLTAWSGHLQQYTQARTVQVPLAREGMYFREFPVQFDWVHLGEGLTAFSMQGLCTPHDADYRRRALQFADLYLPDGTPEPNYDPEHRIIRSLFNGSRGPLLRKATALDWAGDPIDVAGRFRLHHGEQSYEQMLEHFVDYTDIVGDHPQNLRATSLAFHAYALSGDRRYRDWLLEYVDAWMERTRQNRGIIPTNIGLDGRIGSAADGKWYGGVYGWGFTVRVPQTGRLANRNTHHLGLVGFGNALLLTGDFRYVDIWRDMIGIINSQARRIDGRMMYPSMYGDQGWYGWQPRPYASGALNIWYWSMRSDDRQAVSDNPWVRFLAGDNPSWPTQVLQQALETIRQRVQQMREDPTTPDTRLADDPLQYRPTSVEGLVQQITGGLSPGTSSGPLHARLRWFDPVARRPGLPPDTACLVTGLTDETVSLTVVNTDPLHDRELVMQMGTYGEHECREITYGETRLPMSARMVTVRLKPGCGADLTIRQKRYCHQPVLRFPWDGTVSPAHPAATGPVPAAATDGRAITEGRRRGGQ